MVERAAHGPRFRGSASLSVKPISIAAASTHTAAEGNRSDSDSKHTGKHPPATPIPQTPHASLKTTTTRAAAAASMAPKKIWRSTVYDDGTWLRDRLDKLQWNIYLSCFVPKSIWMQPLREFWPASRKRDADRTRRAVRDDTRRRLKAELKKK